MKKIRVFWEGYFFDNEEIATKGEIDVEVVSALDALNAARSSMIEKLSKGTAYGLKQLRLHALEGSQIGLVSMDALNDFVQSFNAEGGTDSVNRVRPKGYTVTIKPDGTSKIETGWVD